MKESIYSLSEFLISKEEGRSTIRLFTSSPTPLEEKNLGQLFAILEIESTDSINEHILDVITEQLNTHYYASEALEFESAFEFALQETNKRIQELVGEVGEDWLHSLNTIIGVRKGSDVIFSHLGRVIAQMIHNDSIVEVLDTTASKTQTVNPVRAFSSVLSGRLTPSSMLFFSTETILDYLSKEKIKRVLVAASDDNEEAISEFYDLLSQDTANANFGAIVIRHKEREVEAPADVVLADGIPIAGQRVQTPYTPTAANSPLSDTAEQKSSREDSMYQLVGRQRQTEDLLSGSIWPSIKKSFSSRKQNATEVPGRSQQYTETDDYNSYESEEQLTPARSTRSSANDAPAAAVLKQVGGVLRAIGIFLWNIISSVIAIVAGGVKRVSDSRSSSNTTGRSPRPSARAPRKPGQVIAGVFTQAVGWFQKLSILQKIFFILAIVVLLIFANSVSNRGEKKIAKENEQQYAQTLSEIDVKINEGKAALIFDSNTSRTLLLEARELLNGIPQDSEAYQERGEELQGVISEQLSKLNNINTIENPTVVMDYSTINPDIKLNNVILLGASMYVFDQNNQSVYRGNLESGETSVAISSSVGPLYREVVKASPGTGLAITSDNAIATFQPIAESVEPLALEYENTENNFVDIEVFGTRLYTLDTANSQIFRHTQEGDTFSAATGWVTDSTDLSNAKSFAIDGNIYVLRDGGSIIRLSGGVQDKGFNLATVDPALENADHIYTDENSQNLYVLDKNNKRVVVFNKDGGFVAQYTSPSFDAIADIILDEANNRIYVLSGSKLFEISLASNSERTQ